MAKIFEITFTKKITAKDEADAKRLAEEALFAVTCEVVEITNIELWREVPDESGKK